MAAEGSEVDKIDHFAELGQLVDGGLHLLQLGADGIGLVHHIEEGIAQGGLEKDVIYVRHCISVQAAPLD